MDAIDFLGAHVPADDIDWGEALAEAATELESMGSRHGYAPTGLDSLRGAIACDLRRSGLLTSEDEVLVTSGAQQAISLVSALYVRPGETVLLENPTYPGAIDAFLAGGARLAPLPVGVEGVLVDSLHDSARRVKPRLIYLIPTFHNPTGTVMPPRSRAEVVRMAEEFGVPVVEDNTLDGLSAGTTPPHALAASPSGATVITIGSLSKLFWGGLRVGWIRAPGPVVSALSRLRAAFDFGTSIPSQVIAVHLLRRAQAMRELRRDQIQDRLTLIDQLMISELPSWAWKPPLGGLALWLQLPRGKASEFAQVALRYGVGVAPGPLASPNSTCGDRIRVAFMREPDLLAEGFARLGRAWQEYSGSPHVRNTASRVLV
jgi:DNA-binding transcriptional MocR family regulator